MSFDWRVRLSVITLRKLLLTFDDIIRIVANAIVDNPNILYRRL